MGYGIREIGNGKQEIGDNAEMQKEMHLLLKKAQKGLLYRKGTAGKNMSQLALKKIETKICDLGSPGPGISRIL